MPRIVVTTNLESEAERKVLLSERVAPADLESAHFSAQLVERVGWALLDANEIEDRENSAARAAKPVGSAASL